MKFIPSTKTMIIGCVVAVWLMLRLAADINDTSILDMAGSYRLGTSVLMVGLAALTLRVGLPFYILNKPVKRVSGVKRQVSAKNGVAVDLGVSKGEIEDEVEELCNIGNNPFLKPNTIPRKVKIVGTEVNMYKFSDIQFDLKKVPAMMCVGESGGGKSITSYNIIDMLNKQYNYPKIAILDMGNLDYEINIGTTVDDFFYVLELFHILLLGRQAEGKQVDRTRIVLLIEEFEAALAGIKLLPKAKRDKFLQKMGDISRMSRKLDINLFFVVQSGKASDFDSSIRNNIGNVFIHRSPQNLSGMFGTSLNLTNIPTGVVWYGKVNGLVEIPLMAEPKMNLMTLQELKMLAKSYQRRFGIGQNVDV